MKKKVRTYSIYSKKKNKFIVLSFPYNQDLTKQVRSIYKGDRNWNPENKEWTIQWKASNQRKLQKIIKDYSFVKKDHDIMGGVDLDTRSIKLWHESFAKHSERIHTKNLLLNPRPYQNLGIDFLLNVKKCLLSDDMGIGKSLTTLFALELGNLFPAIIVSPSSVKYHWRKEHLRINPSRKIQVIDSSKDKIDLSSEVFIINYDLLGERELIYEDEETGKKKYKHLFKIPELMHLNARCVVFDEMHYLKNNSSIRSKIARRLVNGVDHRFGLSGTPIENSPKELINLLNILGIFHLVADDWQQYVYRYCDGATTEYGMDSSGASNLMELSQKLRTSCMLRREKSEVLKDLPPLQQNIVDVQISNLKTYLKAEDNIIEFVNEHYGYLKAESAVNAEFLVLRNELRQLSAKGKMKAIEVYISDFLASGGKKLIVAGVHKEVLKKLSAKFNGILINGEVSAKKKIQLVEEFQESDNPLLFGNMDAMGTGTDGLQKVCSNMLVYELPDKPSVFEQLTSRINRSGQKNKQQVDVMLCWETIDLIMWETLEMKKEVTEAINKGVKVSPKVNMNNMIVEFYKD